MKARGFAGVMKPRSSVKRLTPSPFLGMCSWDLLTHQWSNYDHDAHAREVYENIAVMKFEASLNREKMKAFLKRR